MKIYISGAITGVDPKECADHFQRAEDLIREKGYAPVNPHKMQSHLPTAETTHDEYMVVSLAELAICEAIFMLTGWEKSKGAKIEREVALRTKKIVLYEDEVWERHLK